MEDDCIYPDCKHIRRKYFDVEVSQELALELSQANNEIFPLFERRVHDYKRMKNSSLLTNELLKCRWKRYVHNIERKKRQPLQFQHLNDFHYINSLVRFKPSETFTNRVTYRYQMGNGPGVDAYGQIPIANDKNFRK